MIRLFRLFAQLSCDRLRTKTSAHTSGLLATSKRVHLPVLQNSCFKRTKPLKSSFNWQIYHQVSVNMWDITLAGHSFVRCARNNLVSDHTLGDVQASQSERARILCEKLCLNQHFQHVFTVSDNIVFIGDLLNATPSIVDTCPSVLLIDIGSNDVARMINHSPSQTLDLACQIMDVVALVQAKSTIINAILPRTANISCSPDVFLENSSNFNNYISNFTSAQDNVYYNKMKGFHFYYDHMGAELRLPVFHWSSEGIHCNGTSMPKYISRLRRAILLQVPNMN